MNTMPHRQAGSAATPWERVGQDGPRYERLARANAQPTLRRLQPLDPGLAPTARRRPLAAQQHAGTGDSPDPEEPASTWAFDTDMVFVALGLAVAGIAWWIHSADIEGAGIIFAALASYAGWLDGDTL